MSKDNCATKYCRGEVELTYLGVPLCQECYEKECVEKMKAKKRFNASVRVHVRDKLFGDAIVVNSSWNGESADKLLKEAEKSFAKYLGMLSPKITEKEIRNYAKKLKNDEGWGLKRIKNHFAKFDIDIEPYLDLKRS